MRISIDRYEAWPIYSHGKGNDFEVSDETIKRWEAAEAAYHEVQKEKAVLVEEKELKVKEERLELERLQIERDRIEVARLRANALARQKDKHVQQPD